MPLPAALANWLPFVTNLLPVAGAIALIVQHHRGRLKAGMHKVAVASLIAFGVLYYVQAMVAGVSAGVTAARTGKQTLNVAIPRSPVVRQAGAGMDTILLAWGLIVVVKSDAA